MARKPIELRPHPWDDPALDTAHVAGGLIAADFVIGAAVAGVIGYTAGRDFTMLDAFERGRAVQCLGRTGYHWGCGDE